MKSKHNAIFGDSCRKEICSNAGFNAIVMHPDFAVTNQGTRVSHSSERKMLRHKLAPMGFLFIGSALLLGRSICCFSPSKFSQLFSLCR